MRGSLGTVLALVLPVIRLFGQGVDPVIGTWELSLAKSTFSPGPPPKSQTRTYEVANQAVKFTARGISADGRATLVQYTAGYDGKDYPLTGSPSVDTVSLKRIDAFTTEATEKKGDRVVFTITRVISQDGKVMTVTATGTNAKGETVKNVSVFERR